MATTAQYMAIIGANRIVSFVNDDADVIPASLEAAIYTDTPGTPRVGNRKIVLLVAITTPNAGQDSPDSDLVLKVRVPAGVVAAHVQKFDANTPQLDYYPYVKVSSMNPNCYVERVSAAPLPTTENVANQTLDIGIQQLASAANSITFLLEIDWSHTIVN